MRGHTLFATFAAGIGALALAAHADIIQVEVPLEGSQEVPPNNSPAEGVCIVELDTDTGTVTVQGKYADLTTPAFAAHIHGPANRGQNAGVLIGLEVSGGTTGEVKGKGTLTDAQIADFMAGRHYINVHTDRFPGGEIRGQIEPAKPCYPDCDGNGRLDIRDFFCFQAKFAEQDPYADCDGNRVFDIRDLFCFQGRYAEGC